MTPRRSVEDTVMAPPGLRAALQRWADWWGSEWVQGLPLERFSCFDCSVTGSCAYAFDDYNTDGDCIMEK